MNFSGQKQSNLIKMFVIQIFACQLYLTVHIRYTYIRNANNLKHSAKISYKLQLNIILLLLFINKMLLTTYDVATKHMIINNLCKLSDAEI